MSTSIAIALTAAALAVTLLAHLLNRGRARPLQVGTTLFIPALASRERRISRIREPLLLALRLALLALALVWWHALGREHPDGSVGATERAISALAARGSGASAPAETPAEPLPSPAFAAVGSRGVPRSLTLAASHREGTVLAPQRWPVETILVPPPPREPLRVALLAGPGRATDARRVAAALESLEPARGIRLVQRCDLASCRPAEAVRDLVVALGAPAPADFSGPSLVDRAESAAPPRLEPAGPGAWQWTGRFDPEADPRVAGPAFPEILARLLEHAAAQGSASVAPARPGGRDRREGLALLLLILFTCERWLTRERPLAPVA